MTGLIQIIAGDIHILTIRKAECIHLPARLTDLHHPAGLPHHITMLLHRIEQFVSQADFSQASEAHHPGAVPPASEAVARRDLPAVSGVRHRAGGDEMKKPFYSRRRLKKMGILTVESQNKIHFQFVSINHSLRINVNIIRILKSLEKEVVITVDSTSSSCGSWII